METASKSSIVITGACQNVSRHLDAVMTNIFRIAAVFMDWRVLVLENDSSDDTRQKLNMYAETNPRVRVKDAPRHPEGYYSSDRLALIRQAAVDEIRTNQEYAGMHYVLVVDMDEVLAGDVHIDGLLSCFSINVPWSFMAPAMQPYYDLFALRVPGMYPGNPFDLAHHLDIDAEHTLKHVRKFANDICTYPGPYILWTVNSAFCGMCLYKREDFVQSAYLPMLQTCRFDAKCGIPTECEHVTFHAKLKEATQRSGFINMMWKPTH